MVRGCSVYGMMRLTGLLLVLDLLLPVVQQEELESVGFVVRSEMYNVVYVQGGSSRRRVLMMISCSKIGGHVEPAV